MWNFHTAFAIGNSFWKCTKYINAYSSKKCDTKIDIVIPAHSLMLISQFGPWKPEGQEHLDYIMYKSTNLLERAFKLRVNHFQ